MPSEGLVGVCTNPNGLFGGYGSDNRNFIEPPGHLRRCLEYEVAGPAQGERGCWSHRANARDALFMSAFNVSLIFL